MRHLLLLVGLAGPALGAQTVVVEQRVLMSDARTPAMARRQAREDAMAEAVRQVAGVRVRSTAIATTTESPRALASDYRSVVQLDAAGRAVDVRLVREAWEPVALAGTGEQLYYRASFAVTVQRETGEPDAGFQLQLSLPRSGLVASSAHLRDNDELVAVVQSTRDTRVFLFSLDGDSLITLVPNAYVAQVELRAGESAEVPEPTWRARGLRFRVTRDLARAERDELLVAVAVTGATVPPPQQGTLLDLQRWLVTVPVGQRAMAFAPYSVRLR